MTEPPSEYQAFLDAAAVLCQMVESAARASPAERPSINGVRVAIADALAAAWRLPDIEPTSDEPSPSWVSDDDWHGVFLGVSGWIGEYEYYSTNQTLRGRGARKVATGSVADDLADIWRELRNCLEADRRATPWQDAAWQIQFGLHTHWGTHAVEALRALHAL